VGVANLVEAAAVGGTLAIEEDWGTELADA